MKEEIELLKNLINASFAIFGDDINKMSVEDLKNIEDSAIFYITIPLYNSFLASTFYNESFEKNNTNKFENYQDVIKHYDGLSNKFNNLKVSMKTMGDLLGKNDEIPMILYNLIGTFNNYANRFFNVLREFDELDNQEISKDNYLKRVFELNQKMVKSLKALEKLAKDNIYGCAILEEAEANFEIINYTTKCLMDIVNEDKLEKKSSTVKYEPNEKEKSRLNTIAKANDLYNYFILDFLRDVQNQTPYTARHMIETLDKKHEKFLKSFEMPLANNTSIGRANECINQINNMIDYVTEISKSAYVVDSMTYIKQ